MIHIFTFDLLNDAPVFVNFQPQNLLMESSAASSDFKCPFNGANRPDSLKKHPPRTTIRAEQGLRLSRRIQEWSADFPVRSIVQKKEALQSFSEP